MKQPQKVLRETLEQYADVSDWRTQSYEQEVCALHLFYEKLLLILWTVNTGSKTIVKHDDLNYFYLVLKEVIANLLQQKEFVKLRKKSPPLYEDVLIAPFKTSQYGRNGMHFAAYEFYSEIEKLYNQAGSPLPDSHVFLKETLDHLINPLVAEYSKVIQHTEPDTLSPEMPSGKEVVELECSEGKSHCEIIFRGKKAEFRSHLRCLLLDFFLNDPSARRWLTYHDMPPDILLAGDTAVIRKAVKGINRITDQKISVKLIAVRGHEGKGKKMPNQYRSTKY